MTIQITHDQSGRISLSADCGAFTVIPADFNRFDALCELGTLHSECEELDDNTEAYAVWLSAFDGACPRLAA